MCRCGGYTSEYNFKAFIGIINQNKFNINFPIDDEYKSGIVLIRE